MKNKIIIGSVIALIFAMITFSVLTKEKTVVNADSESEEIVEEKVEENVNAIIYVEVKGAVLNPGVYSFDSETRVIDVLSVAGGLVEGANIEYINQTRIVEDEMLIIIKTNDEINAMIAAKELEKIEESKIYESTSSSKIIDGADNCFTGESNNSEGGLISINNASVAELSTLNGIGEAKANAIVEYRNLNGGFNSIEELLQVSGIGTATFNQIKSSITL